MHRQRHDFLRNALAHRQAVAGDGETRIGGLLVQRARIIDVGRHALRLHRRHESVAPRRRHADRVLRPHRCAIGHDMGDRRHVAEAGVVALRHLLARRNLLFEDRQLLDQDRRLQRVEARIHADADIVVFVVALAVEAQRADEIGRRVIVGDDRAAVAVAAERLGGKETRGGEIADRPGAPALVGRAIALRRIADQRQPARLAEGLDRIVIRGLAEQVDRDHRARAQLRAFRRLDRQRQRGGVEIVGLLVDVDEHRRRAEPGHRLGRRGEGEGRADHRVARPQPDRHQRNADRVGAVGDADAVLRAAEGGELPFELADLRTQNVLPALDRAADRRIEPLAEPAALRFQVDEFDRRAHAISSS